MKGLKLTIVLKNFETDCNAGRLLLMKREASTFNCNAGRLL
jgi:hypothetical protein